ncbi:MAG TPA: hypothetical protein VF954_03815 [Acidimicrobiales bacterium]
MVVTPSSTIPAPPPTSAPTNGPSGHISAVFPILSAGGLGLVVAIFGLQAWLTRPRRPRRRGRRRWTL